jgi:hypothetical protein
MAKDFMRSGAAPIAVPAKSSVMATNSVKTVWRCDIRLFKKFLL